MKKNIIKILRNLFLIIFMIIAAAGCVQDAGGSNNPVGPGNPLIGRWEIVSSESHPGTVGIYYLFNSDGTGEFGDSSNPLEYTLRTENSINYITITNVFFNCDPLTEGTEFDYEIYKDGQDTMFRTISGHYAVMKKIQ